MCLLSSLIFFYLRLYILLLYPIGFYVLLYPFHPEKSICLLSPFIFSYLLLSPFARIINVASSPVGLYPGAAEIITLDICHAVSDVPWNIPTGKQARPFLVLPPQL